MGLFYNRQLRDFGKPHFQQSWGFVQECSSQSSLKFWTEGFLANGEEIKMRPSLLAVTVAWATVGLSAAGLM